MRVLKWLAIIFGVIVLAAAGAYFYAQSSLGELDDKARGKAPGQFIDLSDGKVHYQWHGPADGDVTVLVHGFSTPSFVWQGLLEPLAQAGLRVLTYDNYGRGWSDRPDIDNDADLFDRQLVELLESQGVTESFNLVGYSMGGAISVNFLARRPGRAKRLALIAPAGFPDPEGAMAKMMSLINLPVIGDWAMAVVGKGIMIDGMSRPRNQSTAIPDIVDRYIEQMSYRGYLRSLVSTIRHFPMTGLQAEYDIVGGHDYPVSAVWGDLDSVVPFSHAEHVKRAIPRVQMNVIEGGHHSITYKEHEKVATVLVEFLTETLN